MARHAGSLFALALGSLAVLGCSGDDPRLKALAPGMAKDSALALLGDRPQERPATYLIKGQLIESVMLRREGAEGPLDSLTQKQVTPIVMIDGKLAGWGWVYWDSVAGANKIEH